MSTTRPAQAWIDAGAGVAGDMLLGALLDAGADLDAVRSAVSAVVPGEVTVEAEPVHRATLRATRARVRSVVADHPHRSWATIRRLLDDADLAPDIRARSVRVFSLLAEAEGRVHGVPVDHVEFHEVGSWDSIADVVGTCAAVADLGLASITAGPVALGSGRARSAHGEIPVPVPAVLELARGWRVTTGGDGELATPTGMALVRGLAGACGPLPEMCVDGVGIGAGTRDVDGRPNVVRVVIGAGAPVTGGSTVQGMVVLEANVDDLDPRVWPSVLQALLDHGAADAWLVPILMKKGRPAHTLRVLGHADHAAELRALVLGSTSTLGVRQSEVSRFALDRAWRNVAVLGADVRIKLGLQDGAIVHAEPEFDDVAQLAGSRGLPVRQVLDAASAAADTAGLRPGEYPGPA
ncbi:MAG: nickel pincer cofactor biosynthesis protein LarC [Pseudonocardia sp.]|nr:nickel pincer cofactor biosynthesis protein LarC [Pseudonocardia sp.]